MAAGTLTALYPHFWNVPRFGQVEQRAYSMNRFTEHVSQPESGCAEVTQSDDACDNNSIHAIHASLEHSKRIVT